MTKNDIAIMVAKATGLQQNEVKQVIQLVLDGIVEVLVSNGRLELRGFGVLQVRQRNPRQGRNPMTGESVQVPSRKTVRFQAGKYMIERVNDEVDPGLPDADGSRQRLLKSLMASLTSGDMVFSEEAEEAPKPSRRRRRTGMVRRGRPPRYLQQRQGAEAGGDGAAGGPPFPVPAPSGARPVPVAPGQSPNDAAFPVDLPKTGDADV